MAVFLVFAGDFVDVLPGGKGGQDAERRHPGGEKEMGQRQAIFLQQLLARMPRGAGRLREAIFLEGRRRHNTSQQEQLSGVIRRDALIHGFSIFSDGRVGRHERSDQHGAGFDGCAGEHY